MKHTSLLLLSLLVALLIPCACQKDIPVTDIFIQPASATLFVGESLDLSIQCYPEDATNTDELQVYSTNESIVSYANGRITAKDGGSAAITASCGNVLSQCRVKVYKYMLKKGGKSYGIDQASGHLYLMGMDSYQELDIVLTHWPADGSTQNLKAWITKEQLGQELDFTKPLSDAFVGVYANNNEDGYFIYSSSEGTPMIVTADWSYTDATLVRGLLRVDFVQSNRYIVHADFKLSNGYEFSTDWDGPVSMKTE